MRKYFYNLMSIILFLLIALSCESVVDVDLPKHKPMLVVNCCANTEKPWEVNVSLSKGILEEGDIKIVPNAKIEILDNNNKSVSEFNHYNDGIYKSTGAKPKANINYTLRVTTEEYGTATSNCILPKPVEIENVTVDTTTNKYQEKEFELTITFTDTPNEENFYGLSILKKTEWDDGNSDVSKEWFTSKDILIKEEEALFEDNRSDETFRGEQAFFDDLLLQGKQYRLKIFLHQYNSYYTKTVSYTVLLVTINKDYYRYIITSKTQRETDQNPFAQPTIIYNNIKNGLGIFGGYSVSKYSLKLSN